MRDDKHAAFRMRKSGKSYKEIHQALKIPKVTLSGWFADVDWSATLKQKLSRKALLTSTDRIVALNKIRGKRLERAYMEARREAKREFEYLRYNPVFIAGLMLYWGEGDKVTRHNTRFTNTDPEMIRLFVFFLRYACRVPSDRIKASVLVYPNLDATRCLTYWSRMSGVHSGNFTKCITIRGRHKTKRLPNGICIVVVSSSYLKTKVLEWINLLPKELMRKEYYETMCEPFADMV